jgi:3-deoxy-manno-octulosonate cytidylyltransferase (CMP-KDO synthetase)
MSKAGIFIPVRLGSTRLPNKVTANIGGKPMMIWVAEKAAAANAGDVIFACADPELADVAQKYGYEAVYTGGNHFTGTDCVHAACQIYGKQYDTIVNVQGDIPALDPEIVAKTVQNLQESGADIATAAAPIINEHERSSPHVVKAIISFNGRALYFTRTANSPYGDGDDFHHIGIYAFRKTALERFVNLPQTPLEKRERLEQLRALENGMSISVAKVAYAPHGVDTPEDLELIRKKLESMI